MIVAIDYTAAVRQRAGIGRFTRDLVRALVELDRDNEYRLIVAGARPDDTFPENVRVVRLPLSERALLILWHRLHLPLPIGALIGRVDCYHGANFLLPPLGPVPGIVTIHDLTFLVHPEYAEPNLAKFLKAELPRTLGRAAMVCADSEATRDDIVRLMGFPRDRIAVVTGGVRPEFRPNHGDATLARVRGRYPLDRPYLMALGTVEPRKNLAGLLDAYHLVRASGKAPRLLIAGPPGWRQQGLVSALESSQYAADVVTLGFVPEEDLPALLSLASCFVYPSFYEGFGLPVLEALASGVPVVCSDRSSLPEVAGSAAILANPADPVSIANAVLRILDDPALADGLRRAGPRQASNFTWRPAAEQLRDVYRAVASGQIAIA